ncbi:hypothetical protein NKH77_06255 [Streptomyces sp. M19]
MAIWSLVAPVRHRPRDPLPDAAANVVLGSGLRFGRGPGRSDGRARTWADTDVGACRGRSRLG